jgi:hypothetical protein
MTRVVKAKRPQPLAAGSLPHGYVRLSCGDPALDLIVLLGAEAPQVTGGVGGWTVTPRPQAVGMTLWEGVEPYQVNLSLMLDGWAERRSQESALRSLRRVARGDAESPPGVLFVEGIPLPASRWVIEGIDFGDPILRPSNGNRLRQPLTLTLRQYVPPKFLKRKRSAYGSSSKSAILRAQHGDTPAKIAKRRRLKSWTVIRDLNRKLKLKANTKLKTGQKLRVPATKTQARSGGKDHKRHR